MLVLGIAGGTGSGKTTVVHQIIEELPKDEVTVISQDSYYKKTNHLTYEERCDINFDHPNAIDFDLLIADFMTTSEAVMISFSSTYSFINSINGLPNLEIFPIPTPFIWASSSLVVGYTVAISSNEGS